ncbi:hypothetical protein H9L10_07420 [Phycicoccus endophyticus]|uniref:PPi-type phosphoenolpyruvate carboxykinase lobe 2 domain-containing protein n=1 Tax=Phycicoccus endophyticus TaxID=1690220 RepID=A0A7G9R577_9MICO|nr:hypothetical protein [Phycicoccus endophyticus]NHI20644.1 hypothetical protein [Phycicoccus endophyticus]QNN50752.1 hypothetical protein H9L10_07420 [Phycicoccus endophyticus]GGL43374.1 hypothetical protein GCM10012283_27450 [Phycicoccus endophyticus]
MSDTRTSSEASPTTEAITLRLAALGLPLPPGAESDSALQLATPILARNRELSRRLADRPCAADRRIQAFLDDFLANAPVRPQLPRRTLVLDEPGLARELTLPRDGDEFTSRLVASYRLANGVLHNPANDRRTTAGVFHIAEGGLPIQDDKLAVPNAVYARLLEEALRPPAEDLVLPWTATAPEPARTWVSLLLRPVVVPATGASPLARSMETRFIVPGGLVCNLDFVETVFGNAGDPYLPENDASLDPVSWTGHTGCVILAPHLTALTKRELGLPHVDDATERQRRDGMCWTTSDERYNGGKAFKVTARDARGVVVTVIADNYFGYCKKEVKTQISYAANLFGMAEEEHSGGAICYPAYNLGQEYTDTFTPEDYSVREVLAGNPGRFEPRPEGHAVDTRLPQLTLVPTGAAFSIPRRAVTWTGRRGERYEIPLDADRVYMTPNGYRVFAKPREADPTQWHLLGISPLSTQCHKPATVSGGGKSEISKSLMDAVVFGHATTLGFDADMDAVADLVGTDFSGRYRDPQRPRDERSLLSAERTLGSVIKLLTPNEDFTDEYNAWLEEIPPHVKELVYLVKKYYEPEWGEDWRSHFSVSTINGREGSRVRLDGELVIVNMLRLGFTPDGSWRLFSLRPDFSPAVKVQSEDDITASVVLPETLAPLDFGDHRGLTEARREARSRPAVSRKYVTNCERLLFQRPDDAIHRGYDKQAERDIATPGTFLSNFQPLTRADAAEMVRDAVAFSRYTPPMADLLARFATTEEGPGFVVSSSEPRLVGGVPTKNPRYLQPRPDTADPTATALADVASHLALKRPLDELAPLPVDVVAAGRRNNPPEAGSPALCSYNPLHYMELPELFMEFISSMTGKSPSTTGAGSEGALTKGPFNMLPSVIDLNAAFLSYALTGYDGWVSGAGYIGPRIRVDHDFSLLVPELFARMWPSERDARALIDNGFLEKVPDVEREGMTVEASRLGYRMNHRFATTFFGRIFLHPETVFTDEMLAPELQGADVYADSVEVIIETHRRVAQSYIDDGTIELAVPPLRALLQYMALGKTDEGWTLQSPELRSQFTRESVLASDWYAERLDAKRSYDIDHYERSVADLERFLAGDTNADTADRLHVQRRLQDVTAELARVSAPGYAAELVGTVGRQPL